MTPWDGDSLERLLELAGGNPSVHIDDHRNHVISAYTYRFAGQIGKRVCDFGSGFGFGAHVFADQVEIYVCADISKSFLQQAQRQNFRYQNVEYEHLHRQLISPLQKYQLDTIISDAVFVHFNEYEIAFYLEEFAKILPDSGRVLFTWRTSSQLDSNFDQHKKLSIRNPEFYSRALHYHSEEIIKILAERAGFKYADAQPNEDIYKLAELSK